MLRQTDDSKILQELYKNASKYFTININVNKFFFVILSVYFEGVVKNNALNKWKYSSKFEIFLETAYLNYNYCVNKQIKQNFKNF